MSIKELNAICNEYQQLLKMTDKEIMDNYGESKEECIAAFKEEIDFWNNQLGLHYC